MARKKRDTSKKRESILDAATEAFIAEGYENASMDRISELAGASKRTVYNHFASKEELFRAVLERFMEESFALKQIPYDPKRSLEAQLGDFAAAKLEGARNPTSLGIMRVTVAVFISNPKLAHEIMDRIYREDDALATWLEDATRDGKLEVKSPKRAAEAFWAMVGGAFFWPLVIFGPPKPREAAAMKKELIAMFLARYQR